MKKIVLIIAFSLFAIKSNSQDTNIVYNPLNTNCCSYWSPIGYGGYSPNISLIWMFILNCVLKQPMANMYFTQPY